MNVAAIVSTERDTVAAGVTTGNRYPGAPVKLARERLQHSRIRAIAINNKVANVAAPDGIADARAVARAVSRIAACREEEALSVSTGVIGWSLPVTQLVDHVATLPEHPCSVVDLARAIMTTDRYPKVTSSRSPRGPIVLGVAKGAGMIEPNMATMLGFILTDARIEPHTLQEVLTEVVNATFNAISVDSDQSTSDMVIALANGATGTPLGRDEFYEALLPVCTHLAREIVRNGEGTSHEVRLTVSGIADAVRARRIGRHIINSPLVKTAIYGNDPNVGRLLAAAGDAIDTWDPDRTVSADELSITIGETTVYRDGAFALNGEAERLLAEYLRDRAMEPAGVSVPQPQPAVDIAFRFGSTGGETTVFGSDLSYEYVRENADYRT